MSEPEKRPETAELLKAWRAGKPEAGAALATLLYGELKRLAAHYLRSERGSHTLQPTALVNELYLRMFAGEPGVLADREHLFAVAARQLRHILVDYARERGAQKRGGDAVLLPVEAAGDLAIALDENVLSLHQALNELEQLDERVAKVVELRYFGGLNEEETAAALGISAPTVRRDWRFARSWLRDRMAPTGAEAASP